MRFIIYGAGAIGGAIGARLFQHGQETVLIARGPHLEAMRTHGLVFKTPNETLILNIPCAAHPSEIKFRPGDVVVLSMKTQHTLEALEALGNAAGDHIPVVCAQNGVANERMALRRFAHVYGMVVMLPASHLRPGEVQTESKGTTGILDVGRFPSGLDSTVTEITGILSASNFRSRPQANIMRWKYAKLLRNLNNALQVVCEDRGDEIREIMTLAAREALACYQAAGIDCATREEDLERRGNHLELGVIEGQPRGGSSSWQSVARKTGSVETDYLNGEIVYLGRLHGVATPINRALQRLANQVAREGLPPGSFSLDHLRTRIQNDGGAG